MFEQKFAFSLVVFCSHAAISLRFYGFFNFLDRIVFLNGFPYPFLVYYTPSFLYEPNFHFSLVVFVHVWHFDIDFLRFF